MSTPEERERALKNVCDHVDGLVVGNRDYFKWAREQGHVDAEEQEDEREGEQLFADATILRDCIPVPRAEYDRLRRALCRLCGEPMPPGEEMFYYHGYSGPCPKPPLPKPMPPEIVCLCGSGRFREAYEQAEFDETLAGRIVLTIGCNTKDIARDVDLSHHKAALDELHLRKIDLADRVHVLNVGGYIGDSTRREIEYATANGKTVTYLEAPTREMREKGGEGA